jgi:hypothetical protein
MPRNWYLFAQKMVSLCPEMKEDEGGGRRRRRKEEEGGGENHTVKVASLTP